MKKLLTGFRQRLTSSIQFRLTIYFIIILMPLIFISLYANYKSKQILEGQISERSKNAMMSSLDNMDVTMQSLRDLAILISSDQDLSQMLNNLEQSPLSAESVYGSVELLTRITNINNVNSILTQTAIFQTNMHMLFTSTYGWKSIDDYSKQDWFRRVKNANGKNILYSPVKDEAQGSFELNSVFNVNNLVLMRSMDIFNSVKKGNVLMLSVPKEKLLNFAKKLSDFKDSEIYLYDENQQLLISTATNDSKIPLGELTSGKSSMIRIAGSKQSTFIIKVTSEESHWSLVMTQPESEVFKQTKQLQTFTLLIIVISCFLAMGISWVVYSGISAPIRGLSYGMKQLRLGNLSMRLDNHRSDELGYLTETFNLMAEQQRYLVHDIYEKELRLAQTELNFLQSQINPHFLYNTLDSIYWMSKNYDADDIGDVVLNLSKFFRLSLSKGRDTFSLSETMEHLSYYIHIQEIRFGDKINFQVELDPEVSSFQLLKFLLQPLVENAVIHGLEKKQHGGVLHIQAYLEMDRLKLEISDNGVGIESGRLVYIREQLAIERKDSVAYVKSDDLFALRNVQRRIQIYYGAEAELQIHSEALTGTKVIIYLPFQQPIDKQQEETE
ncbi:sensor histidine kinase [Paenibacillus psychroresistens]|uniref:Sensor histidine kinase n=1 Tax=Paenibacillus psychroresistens TaxID=1778678 RepID=A0A6B8RS77_9BACL|nr:histidine kinase [Paenibacillus psychroresistens]QGQ98313.1 sensor histidine kinase [Paenibacillus psychroresistens]